MFLRYLAAACPISPVSVTMPQTTLPDGTCQQGKPEPDTMQYTCRLNGNPQATFKVDNKPTGKKKQMTSDKLFID